MTEYSVGDRKGLIEKIIKFFDQRVFVVEPDYKKNQYLNFRLSLSSLRPGTPGLLDACDPAGTTFDSRSSDQETAKHFQQPSLETRTDPLSPE